MTFEPTPKALEAVVRAIRGECPDNFYDQAHEAIAAYEAAQWRPIDSAPKDEFVLVVSEGRVHTATLFEPIGWLEADMAQLWDVTHWRPLPPPPA